MRIIAALTVPVLSLGATVLTTLPASAHTPEISADCGGVHVGATAYDANMPNRWSVTIDGVTQDGTFGSSFDRTFPVPQDGTAVDWSAFVEAADGSYHGEDAGTVGPCGTPPPDACPDLPGSQPGGTPCTPPPDVERSDQQLLDGCDVTFQGTTYGAGSLAYDEEYTDTYVFNDQTDTWDLVTDTTATVTHGAFTPWTTQEQADHGCAPKPHHPPAQHSTHTWTHLDCQDRVRVTTTVTTTTPYVWDDGTDTWVPGPTVKHRTTHESPVKSGACSDIEVDSAQASTPSSGPSSGPSWAHGSGSPVPTVIDAGLAAAPAGARPAPAGATPGRRSQEPVVPALLLVSGALLLVAGARRVHRG
ncbi:hypothetical protein [Nocardioides panaciterrulae]|uniref:Uncharacterized protein n=1 Tax=Nocardioides panaciterrulae TaxID=661492 RepID=A0A7Y9E3V9_9ACTN|nr:hypothetical protein [Nocardioides panaciterrulae]NYD40590.1 hypothetical protein [Nocardioides panaciterrulae]